MYIESIHLRNFRNYERLDMPTPGRIVILHGQNAVGKTNIVEAIQLLTAGQSFRHARSSDMLRCGESSAWASIDLTDGNRKLESAISLEEKSRKFSLNGKPKRVADIRGIAPSVTFTPDDLDLIKGSPSSRRSALDSLGVQLNKNYQVILQDFEKVLRSRNCLLKDGQMDMIDALNDIYVKVSTQLQNYRAALFARLEPKISSRYEQLSGGELLQGEYVPSGQDGDDHVLEQHTDQHIDAVALEESLIAHKEAEFAARRTLIGPSRDKIDFSIEKLNAGKFASQGQQRSLVLAWKIAEADVIEEMLSTPPILLLDDVMSELDASRRASLTEYLQRDSQAFITTANMDYFDKETLQDAHIVKLPLETA